MLALRRVALTSRHSGLRGAAMTARSFASDESSRGRKVSSGSRFEEERERVTDRNNASLGGEKQSNESVETDNDGELEQEIERGVDRMRFVEHVMDEFEWDDYADDVDTVTGEVSEALARERDADDDDSGNEFYRLARRRANEPSRDIIDSTDVIADIPEWNEFFKSRGGPNLPDDDLQTQQLDKEIIKMLSDLDDFDPKDLDQVAAKMDQEDMVAEMEEGTWQEKLRANPDDVNLLKHMGFPDMLEVDKRLHQRSDRGLPVDPEDLKLYEGVEALQEDPYLATMGYTPEDFQVELMRLRELYDMARLAEDSDFNEWERNKTGGAGTNTLRFNPRLEEELATDEGREDRRDGPIMPEEVDSDIPLPRERNFEEEQAAKKHKCTTCWCRNQAPPLDPLNVTLLLKFMSPHGSILPRRQTSLCPKWQRKVAQTIRRAKHLGIFSYKGGHFSFINPFDGQHPSWEQRRNEIAEKAWQRVYPDEPFPGLPDFLAQQQKKEAAKAAKSAPPPGTPSFLSSPSKSSSQKV